MAQRHTVVIRSISLQFSLAKLPRQSAESRPVLLQLQANPGPMSRDADKTKVLLSEEIFQNRRSFPWTEHQRRSPADKELPPIPLDANSSSTVWRLPRGSIVEVFHAKE
eukprot:s2280_g3.t1